MHNFNHVQVFRLLTLFQLILSIESGMAAIVQSLSSDFSVPSPPIWAAAVCPWVCSLPIPASGCYVCQPEASWGKHQLLLLQDIYTDDTLARSWGSCAKPRLSCAKIRLSCAKLRLSCAKLRPSCAKPRLSCAKSRLRCAKSRLSSSQLWLVLSNTGPLACVSLHSIKI